MVTVTLKPLMEFINYFGYYGIRSLNKNDKAHLIEQLVLNILLIERDISSSPSNYETIACISAVDSLNQILDNVNYRKSVESEGSISCPNQVLDYFNACLDYFESGIPLVYNDLANTLDYLNSKRAEFIHNRHYKKFNNPDYNELNNGLNDDLVKIHYIISQYMQKLVVLDGSSFSGEFRIIDGEIKIPKEQQISIPNNIPSIVNFFKNNLSALKNGITPYIFLESEIKTIDDKVEDFNTLKIKLKKEVQKHAKEAQKLEKEVLIMKSAGEKEEVIKETEKALKETKEELYEKEGKFRKKDIEINDAIPELSSIKETLLIYKNKLDSRWTFNRGADSFSFNRYGGIKRVNSTSERIFSLTR